MARTTGKVVVVEILVWYNRVRRTLMRECIDEFKTHRRTLDLLLSAVTSLFDWTQTPPKDLLKRLELETTNYTELMLSLSEFAEFVRNETRHVILNDELIGDINIHPDDHLLTVRLEKIEVADDRTLEDFIETCRQDGEHVSTDIEKVLHRFRSTIRTDDRDTLPPLYRQRRSSRDW